MALFSGTSPIQTFAHTPDLLPYDSLLTKRNGNPTGVKKALDWLLPVAGAIGGTLIAPGIGTKIGAGLGEAATGALNRNEYDKAKDFGATDALQNINNSLNGSIQAGGIVNLASNFLNFTPGTPDSTLQSVDPTADASGALGADAMNATGMTDYRTMLNNFQNNLTQSLGQSPALPKRNQYGFQVFADGGLPELDSYKRYLDADKKSEDLLLVDKETGSLFGAMRYGERIFDQKATDTIDEAVNNLREEPSEKGFSWLGKFIFDETSTHKDHKKPVLFAEGGKPEPMNPIRQLQQLLAFNNVYTGPINGKLDDATQSAVYAYNKLNRDNIPAQIELGVEENGSTVVRRLPVGESSEVPNSDSYGTFIQKKDLSNVKSASAITPASLFSSPSVATAPLVNSSAGPVADPTKKQGYNWLNANNILNAGRIAGGLVAANTPYPDEVDTSKFDKLVTEAEARREQGLSPLSRKLALDNLSDNRTAAYEQVRRATGGGGTAGGVLAGIGQIGQNEVAGDLALAQADEQQRLANRMDYRGLLGNQLDIASQRFNRQFGAVQATRQAGLNLIPQGVQGITDDYQYWKNYDSPDSLYQKYLNGQINQQNQQTQAASRIYTTNAQAATAPSPFSYLTSPLGVTGSPLSPVTAPTVTDYRQLANPFASTTNAVPTIPYRFR